MGVLKYKGYTGSVQYNEEDNCLFGKVQGLKKVLISYDGNSIDEIREDFQEAVDYYLESCAEKGIEPAKPFSGRFIIRMNPDLHRSVAEFAASTGSSINDFINRAVINELNQRERLSH